VVTGLKPVTTPVAKNSPQERSTMLDGERIRRRQLPHWDVPHAAYFVTTCLHGSIPARGLLDLERYASELHQRQRPANRSESEWKHDCWKLTFARRDHWLDQDPAVRYLADARLARIVVDAMFFFAGTRYDLLAYVVMPSHYHWVFHPREDWGRTLLGDRLPREIVQHSVNRFSSGRCNEILGRAGPFWQHESYDHWIRDIDELERIILYIENNPVKAGLAAAAEDWEYSSAHARKAAGLVFGEPLIRPG
jgi:type I restriction enzyme R subunit